MKIAVFLLLVTATACVDCTRPSLLSLWSAYPTGPMDELETVMGLPDLFWHGTDAIRLSKAFIDIGLTLDHTQAVACGNVSYAGVKGSRGIYKNKEVFISPEFFYCYLRSIWGPPDLPSVRYERYTYRKKGLIIFNGCGWSGEHIAPFKIFSCPFSTSCQPYFRRTCSRTAMYYLP